MRARIISRTLTRRFAPPSPASQERGSKANALAGRKLRIDSPSPAKRERGWGEGVSDSRAAAALGWPQPSSLTVSHHLFSRHAFCAAIHTTLIQGSGFNVHQA